MKHQTREEMEEKIQSAIANKQWKKAEKLWKKLHHVDKQDIENHINKGNQIP